MQAIFSFLARHYIEVFIAVFALGLTGCASSAYNQAEYGVRVGNEFTFFSRAASTSQEKAGAEVHSDLIDRLIPDKTPKPEGD